MKKIYLALLIAASSPAYAEDCPIMGCRLAHDLESSRPGDTSLNIPSTPMPETPAPAPRNTGGWAACSYGVCNGFNNDGSSWWSSNAGGTIHYLSNQ